MIDFFYRPLLSSSSSVVQNKNVVSLRNIGCNPVSLRYVSVGVPQRGKYENDSNSNSNTQLNSYSAIVIPCIAHHCNSVVE